MAASAFTVYPESDDVKARFHFTFGYAEMENLKNTTRYASAKVEIKNMYTGTTIKSKSTADRIGLNGKVPVIIDDSDNYRDGTFISICSGSIYYAGSPNSPIDWAPECPVYS